MREGGRMREEKLKLPRPGRRALISSLVLSHMWAMPISATLSRSFRVNLVRYDIRSSPPVCPVSQHLGQYRLACLRSRQ